MRVDVYHPILWSKYKAGVFSEMHRLAPDFGLSLDFCQVAESDSERMSLSGVDLARHRYPYTLLFRGAYSRIPKWRLAVTLFRRVLRSEADLVLLAGFSEVAHWGMLAAAMLTGKKRAVFCDSTLRDRPQSRVKGLLKRLYFSRCQGFFTYGRRGREYLLHYGADAARIFTRVQAAALPEGYSRDVVIRARAQAQSSVEAPVFLYVGRLSAEKSLDVLLRAFVPVVREFPDAVLRIVGAGPAGVGLMELRDSLGLGASIAFVGSLDLAALADEYLGATCLVLPSRSEPWGLVVNEALHFGCPAIVSQNCGCLPELVVEGVSGFSFLTGDVEDLSCKLIAATECFADREKTAHDCLRVIGDYTPKRAAAETLAGCIAIGGCHRSSAGEA